MINGAANVNAQKFNRKKSLRDKLKSKASNINGFARGDTQIIILDEDAHQLKKINDVSSTYESLIDKWVNFHSINSNFSNQALDKYEEILLSLYLHINEQNFNKEDVFSLRSLIDNSNAKQILLELSRIDRKIIYKRLESLLFNLDPVNNILKDLTVQKIILGDSIKLKLTTSANNKSTSFTYKYEIELMKAILELRFPLIKKSSSCLIPTIDTTLLLSKLPHTQGTYIIKRINQKAPNVLDLMREKMISLEHGNFVIRYIKKHNAGLLIHGNCSSGKTKLLMALISSISGGKSIAVSGDLLELKSCLKEYFYINKKGNNKILDVIYLNNLAQEIAKSNISLFVADDANPNDLALAWLLQTKHQIPSLVTIAGNNAQNTLYDCLEICSSILKHTNNRDFFYWNFASTFPLYIDLTKTDSEQYASLSNIVIKNNMPSIESSDIKKLLKST